MVSYRLLLSCVASASAVPFSGKSSFSWKSIKHVVAFGDSYSFIQGTNGYPRYSFLGSYLPGEFAYTPQELLSSKIVQNFTGTASGGPNWLEFLTGCAVEDGLWSPRDCDVQLWDFAVAGANVAEEFTNPHHPFTTPYVNQTAQYLQYGDETLRKHAGLNPDKTLVANWIGINDMSDTYNYNNLTAYGVETWPEFYKLLIDTQFEDSIAPLYEAGYRHFLFLNLPPRDRGPGVVGTDEEAPQRRRTDQWNQVLETSMATFAEGHPAANAMLFDVNDFLNKVLDDPLPYGIRNTTDYCRDSKNETVLTDPAAFGCLPLDELFWYDSGHLTSHVHELFAKPLTKFLKSQSKCK